MAENSTTIPGAAADRMEEQLRKQSEALADLRVVVAEVQKDVQVTGERQQEVSEAVKSIADSLKELTLVAERQERLQQDHQGVVKTLHGRGGVHETLGDHHDRIRTLELWIKGVKYVVSPSIAAILVKEALRLWGS